VSRHDRADNADWSSRQAQRRDARSKAPHGQPAVVEPDPPAESPPDLLTEPPLFSECVIGYREWVADEQLRLWPIAVKRRPWTPGINTARCNCDNRSSRRFVWAVWEGKRVLEPAPEHDAPQAECDCGLYSWRRPKREWFSSGQSDTVIGAVASWGLLQVHRDGFRAEHACVVTLAFRPGTNAETMAKLEQIARLYRVDLVPLDELEQSASRHGTPIPDTFAPREAGTAYTETQPNAEPSDTSEARREPAPPTADRGSSLSAEAAPTARPARRDSGAQRRVPEAVWWIVATVLGLCLAGLFAWIAFRVPPGVRVRMVSRVNGDYTTDLKFVWASLAAGILIVVVTAVVWRFTDVLQTLRLHRAVERVRRDRATADSRDNA
jgi:hypothetical protein